MPITVDRSVKPAFLAQAAAALLTIAIGLAPSVGHADSAYVTQAANGVAVPVNAVLPLLNAPAPVARSHIISAQIPTPETSARGQGNHLAQTLQIGSANQVAHLQVGSRNESTVGIIGNMNQIGVLQAGNNLQSNVVLLGTQGLNVGVIQPPGSAPVNMLIARLPNGGLLIKR
ncbi:hypothetical protein U8607_10650 [Methylobacterium durans]|uniref:hypothetical protein n=1 Tax=Methylobacterium durans TaxID=2202825 RepID=UPI002AFE6A39|nr:hypothetical protein [Methylobacterium durans]MEA1832542.1 hypothetical protein [Methylobacterium durans]